MAVWANRQLNSGHKSLYGSFRGNEEMVGRRTIAQRFLPGVELAAMGARGRDYVLSRFTRDQVRKSLLQLLTGFQDYMIYMSILIIV